MASPERRLTGLRVALATALGFSGAAGAVLAGKAILEGTSRQSVSASENQEGGIMPSATAYGELVTQVPTLTITPIGTATKEPTASTTSTPTNTPEKPTSTPTEVPPTQTPTKEPTKTPTKAPEPTPTIKPTEVPTAKPTPAPTAEPVEQPTVPPTPKPEAPSAAFPKEIGNLERDGVMIHNMGSRVGVIDNREDPQNNWAAIVAVARKYAPNEKFEFFYYDKPEDVPPPQTLNTPYKYDPTAYWRNEYPEADLGRGIRGQTSTGVWQAHLSLPAKINPENLNKLNRGMVLGTLVFFINKDNPFAKNPPNFAAILRQQAGDPYNSGRMNFPLRVVYR